MTNKKFTAGPDCYIEDQEFYIVIGDDMRMNGLDSPARLYKVSEIKKLIEILTTLVIEKEK